MRTAVDARLAELLAERAAAAPPRLQGLDARGLLPGHVEREVELEPGDAALDRLDLRLEVAVPLPHQRVRGVVACRLLEVENAVRVERLGRAGGTTSRRRRDGLLDVFERGERGPHQRFFAMLLDPRARRNACWGRLRA